MLTVEASLAFSVLFLSWLGGHRIFAGSLAGSYLLRRRWEMTVKLLFRWLVEIVFRLEQLSLIFIFFLRYLLKMIRIQFENLIFLTVWPVDYSLNLALDTSGISANLFELSLGEGLRVDALACGLWSRAFAFLMHVWGAKLLMVLGRNWLPGSRSSVHGLKLCAWIQLVAVSSISVSHSVSKIVPCVSQSLLTGARWLWCMLLNFIKIRFHGSMPKIMRISHPIVIYKMQILLSWHTAMSHLLLSHIPIYRTNRFAANLVHFMLGVVV